MLLNILMLTIYIVLNIYVIWRIAMWIDNSFAFHITWKRVLQKTAAFVCVVTSSTLIIWIFFPKNAFSLLLLRIGNYWLGFFIEMVACLIISDALFLLIRLIFKKRRKDLPGNFHKVYGGVVLALALILTIGGCIHARHIYTNTYDITVQKKDVPVDELRVVNVADLHMGYSIGQKQIRKMVDKINAAEPDLVLIPGDIFDNNYNSLDHPEKLASMFREIKSKYGVYATFGNHDVTAKLVGGFTVGGSKLRDKRMETFLKDSNITVMLDDTVTIVDDSIYLVGRLDGEHTGDGTVRKSVEELTKGLDKNKPVFMMNHEPVELEEYAKNKVDVLFSGHTHDGQFFPVNMMNLVAWKNAHGIITVGDMYSVVTSGVGVYGPYMRSFTDAEIMVVNIHFENKKK